MMLAMGLVLIAVAWLVPNHHYPWYSFHNEFVAALGLLVAATGVITLKRANIGKLRAPISSVFVLFMAAIPLAQWATGMTLFRGDALMAALFLGLLALSIGTACTAIQDGNASRFSITFSVVLLSGAVVSLGMALTQWLSLGLLELWVMPIPANGRPWANLGQPNNLASLFILGVVATYYLYECGRLSRVGALFIATALSFGVGMVHSRTSLVVYAVLAIGLLAMRHRAKLKTNYTGILVATAVLYGTWLLVPSLAELLDIGATRTSAMYSAEARFRIWGSAIEMLKNQPLTGYGWNQVTIGQLAVASGQPPTPWFQHSHNLVLDLLIWNGLPLGSLIVLLFTVWMIKRILACRTAEGVMALGVLAALLTHGMLEFPVEYLYFLIPMGLAAGILEAQYPARTLAVPRIASVPVLLCSWGLLGFVFVEYKAVETENFKMRFEAARYASPTPADQTPSSWMFDQLSDFIWFARLEAHAGMSEAQLERMNRVATRNPMPPVLFRNAVAHGLNGHAATAARMLELLVKLHPEDRVTEAIGGWAALCETHPELSRVATPWTSGSN